MGKLFLILAILLAGQLHAQASYCSLDVVIVNPDNQEVLEGRVRVDVPGRTIQAEYQRGGVSFCDLGFGPATLTVGSGCDEVQVRYIPLHWGKTTTLRVTYDRKPCLIETLPLPRCEVLYQFRNSEGAWVPGVSVNIRPQYPFRLDKSDAYGRVRIFVDLDSTVEVTATREGYDQKSFEFRCTRDSFVYQQFINLTQAE